jgi:M-phase inducer tyrosine phosphatase
MDISPLPHKIPFFHKVELQSPTPQHTPHLEDSLMQSSPPRQDFVEAPRPVE